MPRSPYTWNTLTFDEGFYTTEVPTLEDRPPVRTFLPTGYEPNYPYPLVVFFHDEGSSEEQILHLAPRISRRNYICISLRGPAKIGTGSDSTPHYSWNTGETDFSFASEYMIRAVELTRRTYHVHSERIYLAGIGSGAQIAYRLGLAMPEKIAGVISLNGTMPRPTSGPLFRFPDVRQLRVLIGHGMNNSVVDLDNAKKDFRLLYAAGVDVRMFTYPTNHMLHSHMLRDVNRWIMGNLGTDFGLESDCDELD